MKPYVDESRNTPVLKGQHTFAWKQFLLPWLWVLVLIAWTWMLLMPLPESVGRWNGLNVTFWLQKGLHVSVYAFLTILTWILPFRSAVRWGLVVFLIAHGGLTEFFQQFVGRGSSWFDWARDTSGVFLGLLVVLGWRLCNRRRNLPKGEIQHDS